MSGSRGAPVVEHDRGLGEQAAEQQVPHHPARRREPEQAVAGARVHVQVQRLQVLEQDAALPLDDRLRQAGRPRRVEHPERVVERQPLGGQRSRLQELVPVALAAEVRQHERPLERRDLPLQLGDDLAPVEILAAVAVAVDREQHLRADLGEAVDHAAHAEVGRAARPDRADRRAGQERGGRLGDVRHVGDHPVAALDARGAQAGRDAPGQRAQLTPA